MSGGNGDPLAAFRRLTQARIGLGRVGHGIPTAPLLDFQAAFARARDAVHSAIDRDDLKRQLAPLDCIEVRSRAANRTVYLARPDLGRQLAEKAFPCPAGGYDLAFVVADGLSATAVMHNAAPVVHATLRRLAGVKIAPVVIAEQARVALGDGVASALGAEMVAVLIGERPGLTAADSMGIYITYRPTASTSDSARNCISNVRSGGLGHDEAAARLTWLIDAARARGLTGVALKDESDRERSLIS